MQLFRSLLAATRQARLLLLTLTPWLPSTAQSLIPPLPIAQPLTAPQLLLTAPQLRTLLNNHGYNLSKKEKRPPSQGLGGLFSSVPTAFAAGREPQRPFFHCLISAITFFCLPLRMKAVSRPAAGGATSRGRKVRAAQGIPLLKMEAAGDSRIKAEENNRPRPRGQARVRRWRKRPPAAGRSAGCAFWKLQVHVNHRLRAARPSPQGTVEGRMLKPCGDARLR